MAALLPSAFDSSSKVLATDRAAHELLKRQMPGAPIARITDRKGALFLTPRGGRAERLNAPPCGACVIVGAADGAVTRQVTALWEQSGLTPPAVLPPSEERLRAEVFSALIAALEAELRTTAQSAVGLDRQIAVLRDDLEDARATIGDLSTQLRQSGALPVECLTRLPDGGALTLDTAQPIRQPLPISGHTLSAIGIAFDPRTLGYVDGAGVQAALIAREDGRTLGKWLIREADLNPGACGWAVLALDRQIGRKYRYLDLELTALGNTRKLPRLLLTMDGGDPRMSVRTGQGAQTGDMLALRLWSGRVFSGQDRNSPLIEPASDDLIAQNRFRIPMPPSALGAARRLTEPEETMNWLQVKGADIFCHPARSTPSVAAVPLDVSYPMDGLSLRLELAHEKAFATQFGVICSPLDLSPEKVLEMLETGAPGRALAIAPWAELVAGSTRPLTLGFSRPVERATLYLATRVTGERNDYAHAWFRDIMILQAGIKHATAA